MSGALDGPKMTYGGPDGQPARQRARTGTPWLMASCLLLAVAILVLTVTGLPGRIGQAATGPTPAATPRTPKASPPAATPRTPAPSSSATGEPAGDAVPATAAPVGADEAALQFLQAWQDGDPKTRVPALEKVATPTLVDQISNTDPAKIPGRLSGRPALVDVSAYAAEYEQQLTDGSAIRIGLVADPDAGYGWLVDSVTPKA